MTCTRCKSDHEFDLQSFSCKKTEEAVQKEKEEKEAESSKVEEKTEYEKWLECLELYNGPCPVEEKKEEGKE